MTRATKNHPTYDLMMQAAAKLGYEKQIDVAGLVGEAPAVLNHWRRRGIAQGKRHAIARRLGIPVEALMQDGKTEPAPPADPGAADDAGLPFLFIDEGKLKALARDEAGKRALGAIENAMIETAERFGVDISKKSEPLNKKSA